MSCRAGLLPMRAVALLLCLGIALGENECNEVTGNSAKKCRHERRYTEADNCKCACGWTLKAGNSTGSCEGSCCNFDNDPMGDYCVVEDSAYNWAIESCISVIGMKQYCAAKTFVPMDGGPQPVPKKNVCDDAGQDCVDMDESTIGEWKCVCRSPKVGEMKEDVAVCVDPTPPPTPVPTPAPTPVPIPTPPPRIDECADPVEGGAVGCAGQATRFTVSGCPCQCGWKDTGLGPGGSSKCLTSCCNPSADPKGDWCMIDKDHAMAKANPKCTVDKETCVPESKNPTTPAPAPGTSPVVNVCERNGQVCKDPNTDSSSLGDWECHCRKPATGKRKGGTALCEIDECKTSGKICTNAGQKCEDKDTDEKSLGDWWCSCPDPLVGDAKQAALAECKDPPGECDKHGHICKAAGQICVDPDKTKTGDWVCRCVEPAVGPDGQQKQAKCEIDECAAVCPTCARTSANGKNVCQEAGQECRDPNTGASSLSDWVCECSSPATGEGQQQPAECELNECTATCESCADKNGNGNVCTKVGQVCVEGSTKEADKNDWECKCKSPNSGSKKGAPADCDDDECKTHGATCIAAGQRCVDPNKTIPDDWKCVCINPAVGETVRGVATCELDECTVTCSTCADHGIGNVCTKVGQKCVDPDKSSKKTGDWECVCPTGGTRQKRGPATCGVDECKEVCPTCADTGDGKGNVCSANGQSCHDENTNAGSLGDWECVCPGGAPRSKAAPATCDLDECVEHVKGGAVSCLDHPRYTEEGCLCSCDWTAEYFDHTGKSLGMSPPCAEGCCNPDNSRGDWCFLLAGHPYNQKKECQGLQYSYCKPEGWMPTDGGVTVKKPVPPADTTLNNVCSQAGQKCVDTKRGSTNLGDWKCVCIAPQKGEKMLGPATCEEDECDEHGATCTDQGQKCEDPDRNVKGDWVCKCVDPATGAVGKQQAATCEVDECKTDGKVCAQAGQTCNDPDRSPKKLHDWTCSCPSPSTVKRTAGLAKCDVDECAVPCAHCADKGDGKGNACEAQGQTCEDPDPSSGATSDWVCKCPPPMNGTATGRAAHCEFDECTDPAKGGTCSGSGQSCVDHELTKNGTWVCKCPPPQQGQATGKAATCEHDECKEHGETCRKEGQSCFDADKTKSGDWVCECPIGTTTVAPGKQQAAQCDWPGECAKNEETCKKAGQTCYDPNPMADGDWECQCQPPASGTPVKGGVATCELDECAVVCPTCAQETKDTAHQCTAAKQKCVDLNKDAGSLGDWECRCEPPLQGAQKGGEATCTLNECESDCSTCAGAGGNNVCAKQNQECVDKSHAAEHREDWVCRCKDPAKGEASMAPATCHVDECKQNPGACGNRQVCDDPNQDANSLNDWQCICKEPWRKVGVAALSTCELDECSAACPTCANGTCGSQECVDPNKEVDALGDWYCQCPTPQKGKAVGKPAECSLDECATACATCADQGGGNLCVLNGQTCHDPNTTAGSVGDWECRCPPPSQQHAKTGGLASCGVDECTEVTETSAVPCDLKPRYTVNGCVCACRWSAGVGDTCTTGCCNPDGHRDTQGNLADWCFPAANLEYNIKKGCVDPNNPQQTFNPMELTCMPSGHVPADGGFDPVAHAAAQAGGAGGKTTKASAARNVCTAANQTCVDPNQHKSGDWRCECPPPSHGRKTGGKATCLIDECELYGGQCTAANQTCYDPDMAADKLGDWMCECKAPASGSNVGAPALCDVDECVAEGQTCAEKDQECVDPDQRATSLNDWMCKCRPPAKGSAVMKPAECELDECTQICHTCAMDACSLVGQTCHDPDKSASKVGDWTCTCPAPYKGQAVGGRAVCQIDECDEYREVCERAGQTCVDPDHSIDSTTDWECHCVAPASGKAKAKPAQCPIDECHDHGNTCAAKGQECVDPNHDPSSKGDWECRCVPPATGTPGKQRAAECEYPGECKDAVNAAKCETVGQVCEDPNTHPNSTNDWYCKCVPPATGSPQQGGPAQCKLDECTAVCPTCATPSVNQANICHEANQRCEDVNQDPVKGLGDWACVCASPATGKGVGKEATCTIDECELYGGTCTAADQTCEDKNTAANSLGDWLCKCKPPATASAAKGPATCFVDECEAHGTTCAAEGQACEDPDLSPVSVGDWFCKCPPPSQGKAVGQRANCTIDECELHGGTCAGRGQDCSDPDRSAKSTWDWRCECRKPLNGSAVAAPAVCERDECEGNTVCSDAGQTCADPDRTKEGDWTCACPTRPEVKAPASPAVCNVDECETHNATCVAAGQRCVDMNHGADSTGDWFCECPPPSSARKREGVANCSIDECKVRGATCQGSGQICVDPDVSTEGDWMCLCPPPATGTRVGGVATCKWPNECEVHGDVCSSKGQLCVDPDEKVTGDWECRCMPPAPSSQPGKRGGPAQCTIDECQTEQRVVKCEERGQKCVDRNTDAGSLGDWECQCVAPETGAPVRGGFATCTFDECKMDCPTCAMRGRTNVCTAEEQYCVDPDTSVGSKGDWECRCMEGSGARVGGPAVCELDECKEVNETTGGVGPGAGGSTKTKSPAETCKSKGQTCSDPGKAVTSKGDWMCVCPPPFTNSKVGDVAQCTTNECANATTEAVCSSKGQICHDPDEATLGDWECRCAKGGARKTGGPATCTKEECEFDGTECLAHGQDCVDPNPDVGSLGDWVCKCRAPFVGNATANVAKCERDECEEAANRKVCEDAGQVCADADKQTMNDWECRCVPPAQATGGVVKRGPATCVVDECKEKGETCARAGQTCNDPNPSAGATGDWTCDCVAPATGSAKGQPAQCTHPSECEANGEVCTRVGQTCKDETRDVMGDWTCNCVAPATGVPGVGRPTVCVVDECTTTCATCADTGAGNACKRAGQTCVDPNKSPSSRGDWYCVCPPPSTVTRVGGEATCTVDECKEYGKVCASMGQTCADPDREKAGDWVCECTAPATGKATARPADCAVDECRRNTVCSDAGQECVDPNKHAGSLNDWYCKCVPPANGTAVGAVARCGWPGECPQYASVCQEVGQTCNDPSAAAGDWECACVEPQQGSPQRGGRASCTLDECRATCATCADRGDGKGNVCEAQGQRCVEGSLDPVTGTGDWRCECRTGTGSRGGGPAQCIVNECEEAKVKRVCQMEEQRCVDPDTAPTSLGDWRCECFAPATGAATGRAAECVIDECLEHEATCAAAGQICVDQNKLATSRNDWKCKCPAPAKGEAVGKAATCDFPGDCHDEQVSSVCTAVGQTCFDPDTAKAGDWECRCVLPTKGEPGKQAAATCRLDECEAVCPTCAQTSANPTHVCAAAEQSCHDLNDNPLSTGDWVCTCPLPQQGSATAAAAECVIDECDDYAKRRVCEGDVGPDGRPRQVCKDPNTKGTSLGDWECHCRNATAYVPGVRGPAKCGRDECLDPPGGRASTCGELQKCTDANQAQDGDYTCECVPPMVGIPMVGGPASCDPVGLCKQHGKVCTDVGQLCREATVDGIDTWQCECTGAATGAPGVMRPATCEVDECKARCPTCADRGAGNVCTQAEQRCVDDDKSPGALSNWRCVCYAPAKGSALTKEAECKVDECDTNEKTCTEAGQLCEDPNTAQGSLGDWTCKCKAPATGKAVGTPAECAVDECDRFGDVCRAQGQVCEDPNTHASKTGDWVCKCPAPATGTPGVGEPAKCDYPGECSNPAVASICTSQQQRCVDPNTRVDGDWECHCMPPAKGIPMKGAPTMCAVDECTFVCPTCARTSAGQPNKCEAAGQRCEDPDKDKKGDWRCVCPPPASGFAVAAVARCEVDECVTPMPSRSAVKCDHFTRYTEDGCQCACNWKMVGAVGEGPGYDTPCTTACCNPDKSKGDWCFIANTDYNRKKGCPMPTPDRVPHGYCLPMGTTPDGAAAAVPNNICKVNNQMCVDTNTAPDSTGDWECRCPPPAKGKAMGDVAKCGTNECDEYENVCLSKGQTCEDPNTDPSSTGDWVCKCPPPAVGEQKGGPATCTYVGECEKNAKTCTDAGQTCEDPDPTKDGDWMCVCVSPLSGAKGLNKPADCKIDECKTVCTSCADVGDGEGNMCSAHGQICVDPDTSSTARANWECRCQDSESKAVRKPARCEVDECKKHGDTCVQEEQKCVDPDLSDKSLGDWMCVCPPPSVGHATAQAAVCEVDECVENGKTCTNAGQQCEDPDKRSTKTGDWICKCPPPSFAKAKGQVADCGFTGECEEHAPVCTSNGQTCVDPSPELDDWECRCVEPMVGSPARREPAKCELDECAVVCPTCQKKSEKDMAACTDANQVCVDVSLNTTGDWECRCPKPQNGSAKGEPAKCVQCHTIVDEDECRGFGCEYISGECQPPIVLPPPPPLTLSPSPPPGVLTPSPTNSNSTSPPRVVCSTYDTKEACTADSSCQWLDDENRCTGYGYRTPTPTQTTYTLMDLRYRAAGEDDDDSGGCDWWCWLLLLLLLCCCFLLGALCWFKRKKQSPEADDERWNKHFKANVEEEEGLHDPDNGDDDAPRTPYSEKKSFDGVQGDESKRSLLHGEQEMAPRGGAEEHDELI